MKPSLITRYLRLAEKMEALLREVDLEVPQDDEECRIAITDALEHLYEIGGCIDIVSQTLWLKRARVKEVAS